MPSPFPGMDPYLEEVALWPAFHHQLVMCLYQILLPLLVDRYRARIAQRRYVGEPTASGEASPERHADYIELRQRSDGKPVTVLEVVSPADKTTAPGRAAYLDKRREWLEANAHVVEIDLVLEGQPTLDYSREGLPDWDYAVTVARAPQPGRLEIYTSTLQKRLPRLRLPLSADDRDSVMDLQTAFTRCYDQGEFAARIDYARDPAAPLPEDDRRWLDELLKQQRRRPAGPTHEEIARVAYRLWEEEGRPHGRDREYWHAAVAQLREQKSGRP